MNCWTRRALGVGWAVSVAVAVEQTEAEKQKAVTD